jgi:S-adenosylmethionine:tRNA ribosyltransferase-isomerase
MLSMNDFDYELPEDKIPGIPALKRADSKLLNYQRGSISDYAFSQIAKCLPAQSLLVFNNSKVFPARLIFNRPTGARIEIFLLEPLEKNHESIMRSVNRCKWKCMIGNRKKWKQDELLQCTGKNGLLLTADLQDESIVEFSWHPETLTFESVLNELGNIPLPPYLNREANEQDKERYQTVYASVTGAVAAPTAGLHFTNAIFEDLQAIGIKTDYLTLHVGAGTFLPVKSENALEHTMHAEVAVFYLENLKNLIQHSGPVIAVGTTAMRSLESLYWIGVNLILFKVDPQGSHLPQEFPYQLFNNLPDVRKSLVSIINYLENHNLTNFSASTSIFIRPGYNFRICKGLITNFHQPRSTLLLLVAALIGDDWRKVYKHALDNGYRFLSYGDSSLLLP